METLRKELIKVDKKCNSRGKRKVTEVYPYNSKKTSIGTNRDTLWTDLLPQIKETYKDKYYIHFQYTKKVD